MPVHAVVAEGVLPWADLLVAEPDDYCRDMADTPRVAVYIDFDNVVISRYDNLHGDGAWRQDNARRHGRAADSTDPIDLRLAEAEVDIGAIIDYASSFGTVAITRAYADWSVPANAAYKRQLIDRAVDLVQLFASAGLKNGADIRLSVDAVDDLFQHGDITHVVIVAGDSDYVPLAQRCKRMGRYVVGIGVAGSTSSALVSACDEFSDYGALPSVNPPPAKKAPAKKTTTKETSTKKATTKKAAAKAAAQPEPSEPPEQAEQAEATSLLERAMRVGLEKSEDGWMHSSSVKSQMQRMNPKFKEKALGFPSFRAFVESRDDLLETQVRDNGQLLVKMR
jgi:NYN domain/OST-HTH/LOTUS domain